MAVYLVSYDLNKQGQDYAGLYEKLKSYSSWCHHLESTWMIKTNHSSKMISDNLLKAIDENDRLLIIEVTSNYSGWLLKEAWEWMESNIT